MQVVMILREITVDKEWWEMQVQKDLVDKIWDTNDLLTKITSEARDQRVVAVKEGTGSQSLNLLHSISVTQ